MLSAHIGLHAFEEGQIQDVQRRLLLLQLPFLAAAAPTARQGLDRIEISDEYMIATVGSEIVATARRRRSPRKRLPSHKLLAPSGRAAARDFGDVYVLTRRLGTDTLLARARRSTRASTPRSSMA